MHNIWVTIREDSAMCDRICNNCGYLLHNSLAQASCPECGDTKAISLHELSCISARCVYCLVLICASSLLTILPLVISRWCNIYIGDKIAFIMLITGICINAYIYALSANYLTRGWSLRSKFLICWLLPVIVFIFAMAIHLIGLLELFKYSDKRILFILDKYIFHGVGLSHLACVVLANTACSLLPVYYKMPFIVSFSNYFLVTVSILIHLLSWGTLYVDKYFPDIPFIRSHDISLYQSIADILIFALACSMFVGFIVLLRKRHVRLEDRVV